MSATWIDSHAHLEDKAFDEDRAAVLERAREAGVAEVVNIGTDVARSRAVLALAREHAGLWAVVGVHPHHARSWDDAARAALVELAADPRVVGIGEIGLDYHYDFSPREDQARAFAAQLILADELDLPIVIHCREAMADTLAQLDAHKTSPYRGVFHCFGGDVDEAQAVLARGFHVSFTGPLTYKKADATRAAAKAVPLDRQLVETDCPYLAPVPRRGKRNEPALVVHTAARLAELHDVSVEQLAEITRANTRALFTRMQDADL